MKEILLLGEVKTEDLVVNDLVKRNNFKILRANKADKVEKLLRFKSPDFVLCTGKILQDKDGNYFLKL